LVEYIVSTKEHIVSTKEHIVSTKEHIVSTKEPTMTISQFPTFQAIQKKAGLTHRVTWMERSQFCPGVMVEKGFSTTADELPSHLDLLKKHGITPTVTEL